MRKVFARMRLSGIASIIFMVSMSACCFGYLPSDINKDGSVDFFDLAILGEQWLSEFDPGLLALLEFDSYSDELVLRRNSTAVQEDFNNFIDVEANKARTEPVCEVSSLELSQYFEYKPLVADAFRGLVLCTESREGNVPVQHLYTTSDGVTFTEILDITNDLPFRDYYEIMTGSVGISSAAVLDTGCWLLALGNVNDFEGSMDPEDLRPSGKLYRSEDAGETWNAVLSMTYGYVPEWGWGGISGNYVTVAEYGKKTHEDPNHNPCKVYFSDDYGENWECIYTLAPLPNRHIHQAVFAPGRDHTRIYFTTGDPLSGYSDSVKMYCLDKNIYNVWSVTKIVGTIQPCGVITVGNSIYWGSDERALGGVIVRHWSDNDVEKFEPVLRLPEPDFANSSFPYSYIYDRGHVFSIYYYDGVYYAAVSDHQPVGGIYVSEDLKNWVCARRIDESWGCRIIAGYANGKIWGSIRTGPNNISKGFSFSPVTAKTINAIRCERGMANILNTADESTFDLTDGQWDFYGDADIEASGYTEEDSLHGDSCFKLVYDANGTHSRNYTVVYPDWFKNLGGNPVNGDIVTCSFMMKVADSWPRKYKAVVAWKFGPGVGDKFIYNNAEEFQVFPGAWRKYTIVAKAIEDVGLDENFRIELGIQSRGERKTSDAVLYIDCVQVTYSSDRFNSGCTFQPGDRVREDESIIVPLCGLGDAFTSVLEWHPMAGDTEFRSDIPIATWVGADKSYMELYWDQSQSEMKLTDGFSTISSNGTSYPFKFADYLRFALVSDANGSMVYVQDPVNGMVTVGDGSDVKLGAEPVLLRLGTNDSESDFGCGCFCNIKAWDSKLSSSEIEEVISAP